MTVDTWINEKIADSKSVPIIKAMMLAALEHYKVLGLREMKGLLPNTVDPLDLAFSVWGLKLDKKINVFYKVVDKQGRVQDQRFDDISDIFSPADDKYADILTYMELIGGQENGATNCDGSPCEA